MISLLLAITSGIGVFYIFSALSLGWNGLGFGPRIRSSDRSRARLGAVDIDVWLQQAGLDGIDKREFVAVVAMLSVAGFLLSFAAFGGLFLPWQSVRSRHRCRLRRIDCAETTADNGPKRHGPE